MSVNVPRTPRLEAETLKQTDQNIGPHSPTVLVNKSVLKSYLRTLYEDFMNILDHPRECLSADMFEQSQCFCCFLLFCSLKYKNKTTAMFSSGF